MERVAIVVFIIRIILVSCLCRCSSNFGSFDFVRRETQEPKTIFLAEGNHQTVQDCISCIACVQLEKHLLKSMATTLARLIKIAYLA